MSFRSELGTFGVYTSTQETDFLLNPLPFSIHLLAFFRDIASMSLRLAGLVTKSTRQALGGYGRLQTRYASTASSDVVAAISGGDKGREPLKKGAKRDPELYVRKRVAC